jgi:hypothetical protein
MQSSPYWDPGRLIVALLFNSSVHMFDQISNAVRELDHFSLSLDVEIDCAITCGSTIDRFFQVQERLDDLTRQDEADPYAQQKSKS